MKFADRVYFLCRKIPAGKVTTYKEIGQALGGRGQVYRAVGQALHQNPSAPEVPCHRVVKANGSVGKFSRGTREKIKLLKKEGVKVVKGKIDLKTFLFKF